MKKLCIIVPAHNEEKRIGRMLEAYSVFFEKQRKKKVIDYGILVIINHTDDGTEQVVKKNQGKNKRINYRVYSQGGKGFAVKEGFATALKENFDYIGFVDADMATPPTQYWKLIMGMDKFDGCVADRYTNASKIIPAFSFRRIVVSRVFNFLVRVLFLLQHGDTQCGAKVFNKLAVKQILDNLTITQWAFDIDLMYICKKNGLSINRVPTVWYEIEGGTLNIIRASIEMFLSVVQLRILHSLGKIFLPLLKPIISKVYKIVKKR